MTWNIKYDCRHPYEFRTTVYEVKLDNYTGSVDKHNGEFVYLKLFGIFDDDSWEMYHDSILCDNNSDLIMLLNKIVEEFEPIEVTV